MDGLQLQHQFQIMEKVDLFKINIERGGTDHFVLKIASTRDRKKSNSEIRFGRFFKT